MAAIGFTLRDAVAHLVEYKVKIYGPDTIQELQKRVEVPTATVLGTTLIVKT